MFTNKSRLSLCPSNIFGGDKIMIIEHKWVTSVLQDLHNYSKENELPKTAKLILGVCEQMHIETNCVCEGKKLSNSWCEEECSAKILRFPG